MNIISNNEKTEVLAVATSIGGISFTMENISIQNAVDKFSEVTDLSVADGEIVCGIYKNLVFSSALVDAEGIVKITYRIKAEDEVRLDNLETSQAEVEEMLAEILYGSEESTEEAVVEETEEEIVNE